MLSLKRHFIKFNLTVFDVLWKGSSAMATDGIYLALSNGDHPAAALKKEFFKLTPGSITSIGLQPNEVQYLLYNPLEESYYITPRSLLASLV